MVRRLSAATGVLLSLLLTAPAKSQPSPAPEVAPGGTVVLRGSTPTTDSTAHPLRPGPSNPLSTTPAAPAAPSAPYGWDTSGFDRRFDRSGLTPQN
jgi:hypothetical protein